CYSLVHDDLPPMDDDDLRRGKPSCHIAFGEANAILAGDALQALAFEALAGSDSGTDCLREQLQVLARASGSLGMVGGQAIDLAATGDALSLDKLCAMHRLKTGALIESAVELGSLCAAADQATRAALQSYARSLGLAFQIQDDVLDVSGSPALTGKTQGADAALDKPTFTSLMGLAAARDYARQTVAESIEALIPLGASAAPLVALADYVVGRQH
ncbi:MAG: geranyl transferase, partial [Pseudomonadales bacterium]|nr:geranyl transferase [Pseudomonadales bacterium]